LLRILNPKLTKKDDGGTIHFDDIKERCMIHRIPKEIIKVHNYLYSLNVKGLNSLQNDLPLIKFF
jgi:hypothetical protein